MRILLVIMLILPTYFYSQPKDTLTCGFSCCSKNSTAPAGVMVSHVHNKKEWMLSYRFMSMAMNGIIAGTKTKNENDVFVNYLMAPKKMRMDMHMLMAMYGITNRLTVMTMVNCNVNTMDMNMFTSGGHIHAGMNTGSAGKAHEMKSSGFGDIKLHVLYALVKKQNHQLIAIAGLGFPTGNINLKGKTNDMMYPGQRLPYNMQLGSGTWDFQSSVNYVFQKRDVSYGAQLSSLLRQGYNAVGYAHGNEFAFNSWFAYQWLRVISSSVRLEATAEDKISGYDPKLYYYNEPSANPNNYGGKKVNCYFGSVFHFKNNALKNHRLAIEYGIPVYQNLNGIQMPLKHTLFAAWAVSF